MKKSWRYHGECCASGGPAAKNPRGLRPLGFCPWDLPRHNIYHDTSSAFSNNFPNYFGKSGKEKYKYINCKHFYKGQGCKRGSYCWFSHDVEKSMERYCPYWWDGRCRYAAGFCRSGKHRDAAINQ